MIKYFFVSLLVAILLATLKLGGRSGNAIWLHLFAGLFFLSGLLFNHLKDNYGKITDGHMYKITAGVCLLSFLFIPAFSWHVPPATALGYFVSFAAINAVAVYVISFVSIRIIESAPSGGDEG
ncbi:hypothetical protein [Pseudomonas sp. SCB32]|uniref:hypothetical protein n=1 Tax=Pseudomonas sp. SCB32 TaxID=2653853 RepID=UPI001265A7DB|nr:hypothetical protein [Pseudomonas sp. SCB32]